MKPSRRTGVRLGSFALVLAGTFGTAYAIGERLPGHNHSPRPTHDPAHGGAGDGYQLATEQIDRDRFPVTVVIP